jgi:FkbH-like protein
MLETGNPRFGDQLREETLAATACDEVLRLSMLRRKAEARGLLPRQKPIRVAVIGGYTLHPFTELLKHFLATVAAAGYEAEIFQGDYDNYISEIADETSELYSFAPEAVILLPSHRRCQYTGGLLDTRAQQEASARAVASQILELCGAVHDRTGAEVITTNFALPGHHDPGSYRTRTLASDWSFRKLVNLELGLSAPSFVHICDVEFLSCRVGTLAAWDARSWFESKQAYAPALTLLAARETARLVFGLYQGPKKVAVLDLDNTLWGGVIGDDGLDGIEIGDTSPRGEAFKAFQQYLLSLTHRGTLLAVCSKNDHARAAEPFQQHPEMVLRMKDFASFQANWQPKSENIRAIAKELNLGLDSLVFIDDNPAEVDIVRQFVPEVECILLSDDPSEYVGLVQDSRYFEPVRVTEEDLERATQYRSEAERSELLSSVTDMGAYLDSLRMEAHIAAFRTVDVPRIAQLINKSNQFNLTTRRRTESQVMAILSDSSQFGFTVRLADRFGDHGLISVVILREAGDEIEIDTWLMSCRVLKRQVEDEVLNQIVRYAQSRGGARIRGVYLPTAKNGMVREHYPQMGFSLLSSSEEKSEYVLDAATYAARTTKIRILDQPL